MGGRAPEKSENICFFRYGYCALNVLLFLFCFYSWEGGGSCGV